MSDAMVIVLTLAALIVLTCMCPPAVILLLAYVLWLWHR